MGNTFLALPAPAGNASGAAVDVSAMGAVKTIVVEGNGSGLYEPYVQIEVSNDNAFQIWTPIYRFQRPGSITVTVACRYMRATVQNYTQGGAPTVNVGAEDTGAEFAELVAPAGNGFGASVDVSALPPLKTFQVSGTFKGNCAIQISNDGGTTWSQADGLSFNNKGGLVTIVIVAEFMRIARSGIQAREPNPGLPVIDIGAALNGSGDISGGGTLNRVAKFTAANQVGDSSITDNGTVVSLTLPTTVPVIAAPPTPAAGVNMFASTIAGRSFLSEIDTDGRSYPVQPSLASRAVGWWMPAAASSNPQNMNLANIALSGTPTARTPAATNLCTSSRRLGMVSAAGAGSQAYLAPATTLLQLWRGNAAGLGGFYVAFRFAISDAVLVATANMFVGLRASLPGDVAPSTLVNQIGIGVDNGDTELQLYAAGAVAQPRVSLGVNFPANTISTDVYELVLACPPNAAYVDYQVSRLNVPAQAPATGRISVAANLPANTQFLAPYLLRSNGGTAAAVAFDFMKVYAETSV